MNRAYRSIWNESLGTWVAVSELASARGKPKKSKVVQAAAVAVLALGAQVHDAHAQYVANASSSATQGASIAIGSAGGGDSLRGSAMGNRDWWLLYCQQHICSSAWRI